MSVIEPLVFRLVAKATSVLEEVTHFSMIFGNIILPPIPGHRKPMLQVILDMVLLVFQSVAKAISEPELVAASTPMIFGNMNLLPMPGPKKSMWEVVFALMVWVFQLAAKAISERAIILMYIKTIFGNLTLAQPTLLSKEMYSMELIN